MPTMINELLDAVSRGNELTKEEALILYREPLETLCAAADEVRRRFCHNHFDLCSIINGKSGCCSEDCKFCAQAACSSAKIDSYNVLSEKEIVSLARHNAEAGALRYSIVTSGKRLKDAEVEALCCSVRAIRKATPLAVCVSFGLLNEEQFRQLKSAGVTRVHNNLETSRRFFPSVCTTHRYDDKIATLLAARRAGLELCSGGIFGMGETAEDRVDFALTLRELGIRSVPVNFLNPVPGTPFQSRPKPDADEARRIVAILRFILPDAAIRLAGGRGLLADKGEACFRSGANAAISGDMLTTEGISIAHDLEILGRLGYKPSLCQA